MSEDNTKTVSEETITSIVDAAQDIAKDSDAMRQNLVAIAEAMKPIIQKSGIRFGGSETWQIDGGAYGPTTFRIGIRKDDGGWVIGIESTDLYPREWDGSRWIGYIDPFDEGAWSTGNAHITEFVKAGRHAVENAIRKLPSFMDEYCAELKRRHQKYVGLRNMVEAIKEVVE